MRIQALLLPAALLAAPALAQTPRVFFTADSNVGSFAKSFTKTALVTVRRGRGFVAANAIILFDSTTARLSATSRLFRGLEATLFWWGRGFNVRGNSKSTTAGTTQSTDFRNIVQGPHSIMVHFVGNARGTLEIFYGGRLDGRGSRASVKIDIDADNRTEFQWAQPTTQRRTIPFTVSGTRRIRVTGDCFAQTTAAPPSSSGYQSSLSFLFRPFPGKVFPYGTSCGPSLTGRVTTNAITHTISLSVTRAFPSAPAVFAFGGSKTNLRIPGTSCFVLTPAAVLFIRTSSAFGSAATTVRFRGFPVGSLFSQVFSFDLRNSSVTSSNGIEIRFAP